MKKYLNPTVINGIKIPESYIQLLQELYVANFSMYKVRITQRIVEDVANDERKLSIIANEHRRAHRNPRENTQQILERFYFPRMAALVRMHSASCDTCKLQKYDRHPCRPKFQPTPIPSYPCEILHVDIFELEKEKFISCLDKFSKFAKLFHIRNRSAIHLREKMAKVVHFFSTPRMLVTDNERGFISPTVADFIASVGIELYRTPTQRSEVNGQVERLHSTLLEMYRCLRREYPQLRVKELLYITVDRYNNSVHSMTRMKPVDIFLNRTSRINYQNLTNFRDKVFDDVRNRIMKGQEMTNARLNRNRTDPKGYEEGKVVFIADRQIKGKHRKRYKKEVVSHEGRVTLTTETGKKFHKCHVKNV